MIALSFTFMSLTQVLGVANIKEFIKKLELVPTYSDVTLNSIMPYDYLLFFKCVSDIKVVEKNIKYK